LKLREWQEKAFPKWWAKKQGIVKVVTGGGKTFFAIFCLKKYLEKDPTKKILIIVPSIALLDQWYESLSQSFSDNDIGLNGGGEQASSSTKICISTMIL
jgi:DNA or RNA helicases of superfamily II